MADLESKMANRGWAEKYPGMAEHSRLRPDRTIALVGLMGAGKSAIGRRLAARLELPFVDADTEIEKAAGHTIDEIFSKYGEAEFRDGERRVIARLLERPPMVLATGGGAFMDPRTRELLHQRAFIIWLRADLQVLLDRVARRSHRPLLKQGDPREILQRLMAVRYPIYAEADVTIDSHEVPAEATTTKALEALQRHLQERSLRSGVVTPAGDQTSAASEGMDMSREVVHVGLAERGYDIEIGQGLLTQAASLCGPHLPGKRAIIVTDSVVAAHYLAPLESALGAGGIRTDRLVVPAGEASKDFSEFARLMNGLLDCKPDRRTVLIALGGGVVGDLTGFAASVLLRGVDFIQIPTTLLAQVDSSVGGKTGINSRHGKNLVGTFHQPRLVLADTGVLDSLPRRELLAGYAEIAKYGLIDEPDFFGWLEHNASAVIAGDAAARRHAIAVSCRAKARIVAADERETGDARALLNLGHTFAHALEKETGYGTTLLHGEAVAIGMVMAFDLSQSLGLCAADDTERVRRHLASVGLPVDPRGIAGDNLRAWDAARLLEYMRTDKKAQDGRLTFVLARGIGRAFVARDVDAAPALGVLQRALAA